MADSWVDKWAIVSVALKVVYSGYCWADVMEVRTEKSWVGLMAPLMVE